MKTKVSTPVANEIEKIFDAEIAATLVHEVEDTEIPTGSECAERVHMAILLGSNGSGDKFRDLLKLSRIDWRDTRMAAGLVYADWRDILKRRGYWPP
jgi:hypothetical protein